MVPGPPDDATGQEDRPSPGSAEAAEIARAFSELLNRDPQAVIDSTRDMAGHVVLNADDLFRHWPEYAGIPKARRWLGPLLYATARDFIDRAFASMLREAPAHGRNVVFTAGGGASGKSTVLGRRLRALTWTSSSIPLSPLLNGPLVRSIRHWPLAGLSR